jgi:hypothetical protein
MIATHLIFSANYIIWLAIWREYRPLSCCWSFHFICYFCGELKMNTICCSRLSELKRTLLCQVLMGYSWWNRIFILVEDFYRVEVWGGSSRFFLDLNRNTSTFTIIVKILNNLFKITATEWGKYFFLILPIDDDMTI